MYNRNMIKIIQYLQKTRYHRLKSDLILKKEISLKRLNIET